MNEMSFLNLKKKLYMKTNNKLQDLILEGFSIETIGNLTESQLNALHKRVVKEQTGVTTKERKVTDITIPSGVAKTSGAKLGGMSVSTDPSGNIHISKEMGESKKRKSNNPWAICTSSLSDEFGTSERSEWTKSQKKKYERCVMDVKKSIKEGRNPYEPIIESKIIDIVKNNIQPRMTKKDFITTLIEQSPKEKEKTKAPTKTPQRQNPFRNPNPGTKEKPRGKAEKMKSDFINLIKKTIG